VTGRVLGRISAVVSVLVALGLVAALTMTAPDPSIPPRSWVFEVPVDRLVGAELVVENDGAEFDAYDRGLRVDLGIVAPTVADRPLTLSEGSVRVSR
jgi:hypothetical protein